MLIVTDNTSAGYHGITEDSYTATPTMRNTNGKVVYNASEAFGYSATNTSLSIINPAYTSMGSHPSATTDSYNNNGTQRSESGNSTNGAETFNVTSSYYYNMSHTNASSINSYAIGNGTHVAYFDCPPGTEPSPHCWGKTFLLPQKHIL